MTKSTVEKLGLHKYKTVVIINQPKGSNYFDELQNFSTELKTNEKYDLIFSFALDIEEMKDIVNKVIKEDLLNTKGYLYIAYPKKGNKVYETHVHRDEIFPSIGVDQEGYVQNSNVKFARMVALDEVFTIVGLKEDAKGKGVQSTKASQCVDDYIDFIPHIEKDLEDSPEQLAFYQSLTPGYRKDWARYVYSAKQEATKAKRREEMKIILSKGYKTRDLYKLDK